MKNILLGFLAIGAIALGVLLWQQNQKSDDLAQQVTAASKRAQDAEQRLTASQKNLTDTEQKNTDLEAQVKKLETRPTAAASTQPARARDPNAALAGLAALDNPAVQKVMSVSLKSNLDQRYASLFRMLKLSPTDLDKFKDLLVEKQMSGLDALRVAQSQGMAGNPQGMLSVMNKVQGELDDSVHSLLGDQGFQQYQQFNQNTASYSLLDQIERRLSYTNAPLQESQTEPLLQLLENTTQPTAAERAPGANAMMGFLQGFAGSNPVVSAVTQRPITNDTIEAANSVLNPSQIEALKQLQAEQKNQAATLQNLRGALGPGGGSGTGGIIITPPASSTAKP